MGQKATEKKIKGKGVAMSSQIVDLTSMKNAIREKNIVNADSKGEVWTRCMNLRMMKDMFDYE